MQKTSNFIKWFIIFMASLIGTILAWQTGLLDIMIRNDISYICISVLFLYFVGSIYAGRTAFLVDEKTNNNESCYLYSIDKVKIKKKLNILWFMAEHFMSLGLLGTVVGFSYVMYGSLKESQEIKQIINQLKVGMSTALYTTIFGLVYSLFLQLQTFVLQNDLKDE